MEHHFLLHFVLTPVLYFSFFFPFFSFAVVVLLFLFSSRHSYYSSVRIIAYIPASTKTLLSINFKDRRGKRKYVNTRERKGMRGEGRRGGGEVGNEEGGLNGNIRNSLTRLPYSLILYKQARRRIELIFVTVN